MYDVVLKGKVPDSKSSKFMNREHIELWLNSKYDVLAGLAGPENEYLPSNVEERIVVKYRGPDSLMPVYKKSGSEEIKIGSIENPYQEFVRSGVNPIMEGKACIGFGVSGLSDLGKDYLFSTIIFEQFLVNRGMNVVFIDPHGMGIDETFDEIMDVRKESGSGVENIGDTETLQQEIAKHHGFPIIPKSIPPFQSRGMDPDLSPYSGPGSGHFTPSLGGPRKSPPPKCEVLDDTGDVGYSESRG